MLKRIDVHEFTKIRTPEKSGGYSGSEEKYNQVAKSICNRYSIYQKNILSIGAGACYEEIALINEGRNVLYVVDIDESGNLMPIISECEAKDEADTHLNFIIDDFTKMDVSEFGIDDFGVVYVSSFTPDEMRRDNIKNIYTKFTWILRKMMPSLGIFHFTWPLFYVRPVHKSLEYVMNEFIQRKGLFILQSYCGGIDPIENSHFVKHIEKQLSSLGMTLVEAYRFKVSPAIVFWVAIKGDGDIAREYAREINLKEPIKYFHARAEIDNSCVMFYTVDSDLPSRTGSV